MLALKIQPGTIISQMIIINEELSYRVALLANRGGHRFTLKVTAQTLLGTSIVSLEHFSLLNSARQCFDLTVTQLRNS